MLMAAPPPTDPGLADACGEDPGLLCETVWDATDSTFWSKVADWVIGKPLTIMLIFLVAWIVARIARRLMRRAVRKVMVGDRETAARTLQRVGIGADPVTVLDPRRTARAESIATMLASTATVVVWVIALFMVVGELGIDLAPLIAGAGIAGVALGFGAQSLVKDCLTGVFMLLEDQYGIGDVVDLGEATGVVEKITLRTTVLRGGDGTVWHVPNGEVVRVGNRSQLWSMAVLDVVVAYDANLDLARHTMLDAATRLCETEDYAGDVLEAPELLGVEAMGPAGINLRLHVKTAPGAQYRLQRALREAIRDALVGAGVGVPPAMPPPAAGPADRPS